MAVDNVTLAPASGGAVMRTLSDGTNEWVADVVCYATTLAPGANVLQPVTPTLGLPVVQQSGGNWACNIAQYLGGAVGAGNAIHVQPGNGALWTVQPSANTPFTAQSALPVIVQKKTGVTGSAGKTLAIVLTSNETAGNTIIVSLGTGNWAASNWSIAVTDSLGNTYVQDVSAEQSTTQFAAVFRATNILAGANTITITISGSSSANTAIAAEVYEVWGLVGPVSALEATGTQTSASGTSVTISGVAATQPNDFAVAALSASTGTLTAAGSYSLDSGTLAPTGGNLVSFGSLSYRAAALGNVSSSIATIGSAAAFAAALAVYRTAAVSVSGMVSIAGGSATIGAVTQASGPWTFNLTQIAGSNIATAATGIAKVGVCDGSGTTISSNNNALVVQDQPQTTGGLSHYKLISANSTNAQSVKASAGQVYNLQLGQSFATPVWLKLYDKASAPTVGTDTPVKTLLIPGNTAGGGHDVNWPKGLKFTTGIAIAVTGGSADADTTTVPAGIAVCIDYL